jgi:hypothetical protein
MSMPKVIGIYIFCLGVAWLVIVLISVVCGNFFYDLLPKGLS